MVHKINDNLYVIKIRLDGSPLRDLNCYVIKTPERNLLIDTGFNTRQCHNDLEAGIQELGLDLNRTDILVTHLHVDHFGLVGKIHKPGCRIYMGETDVAFISGGENYWPYMKNLHKQEGFPLDILEQAGMNNPSRNLIYINELTFTPLKNGEELMIGGIALECIHTPGHTPGHICLYNKRDKFMILGDHVLFDISPNISVWPTMPNALSYYLDSLQLIKGYDVLFPLPGHRECTSALCDRIDALLIHHKNRLEETMGVVFKNPGINGYDVAGRLKWSIRARDWEGFPTIQRWFAVEEALAHLSYLVDEGKVQKEIVNGMVSYTCT